MRVDLRCYAIVDPEVAGGHELADLCRMLAAGGVTLVQLRDKLSDTRVMVERARAIKAALGRVPLLINDRVDVALAIGCDGVHIGWDDMAPADARRLLGPDAIIGLTINSPQRADATDLDLIDYAGIGGVYGTTSKATKNSPIGIAGMARVIEALHRRKPGFPTCGIAGINAGNAAPVIEAGADGVSVISALSLAKDPQAAAARIAARGRCGARQAEAADDRDRRHHRGLGFRRRRRHPGRPEDVLGARRLWRVGDHRADGAEHQGRHRHPRRAAGVHRGADRCGVLRSRRSARSRSACCRTPRPSRRWRRGSTATARPMSCSIR